MNRIPFLILGLFLSYEQASAACSVFNSSGGRVSGLGDPLFELLDSREICPANVMELRALLKNEGDGELSTSMVANRGFHNPRLGSFSFFETLEISGQRDQLFFGHFTTPAAGNRLGLDQNPAESSLMVELIAWDRDSEMYNFYELIGSPQGSKWFYRGNSADIWADTEKLHRKRAAGEPIFGGRLRCSGCHISGGPIMKELAGPHDSWWSEERPLPLGGRVPTAETEAVMKTLRSPGLFADSVKSGLSRLINGKAFKTKLAQSPQVALRPLFCPEEINFQSAPEPLDGDAADVQIPSGFFVDERFGVDAALSASKAHYLASLQSQRSRFPETERQDSDHAWLAPVKAASDQLAVARLVPEFISSEFVMDVLAVDQTRPVFSQKRCELLPLLPTRWGPNWQDEFRASLLQSPLPGARELHANLTDVHRTSVFHRNQAQQLVSRCTIQLATEAGTQNLVQYLGQSRSEIGASEISKSPRGQILEPGFRVIFPVFSPQPRPWIKHLDAECVAR